MPIRRRIGRSETPLEALQKELLKKEAEVSRKMQGLTQSMRSIPQAQKEPKTPKEKTVRVTVFAPPVLPKGYHANTVSQPTGSLRTERRRSVVKLIALLWILFGVLFWIYTLKP